nr:unnamed protein product [Digitaria exilis]
MADETLAAFMDVTGCGYDDAFHRLASCGGHLGNAINRFFSIDAGPSRTPASDSDSDDSDDDDDVAPAPRAPVPWVRSGGARGRSLPSGPSSSPRATRWDDDGGARGGGGRASKSSRRRRRARDRREKEKKASGSQGGPGGEQNAQQQIGRRRFREDSGDVDTRQSNRRRRRPPSGVDIYASSSSDEGAKNNRHHLRRRRLNPKENVEEVKKEEGSNSTTSCFRRLVVISDDDTEVGGGGRGKEKEKEKKKKKKEDDSSSEQPPESRKKKKKLDKDELFRVPHGLRCSSATFHGAKAEAGRRARWLLANVQCMELASLAENRDVWGSDLVAQCVRDHFVLWQAFAGGGDEEGEEAAKVLCYHKVPRDRLPVVLVVDPVTGQAIDRLHGTDPNDFLVSMAPYTNMKPALPFAVRAAAATASTIAAAAQSNQKPATATSPASRQEPAPTALPVRKPDEPVAAVVAAAAGGHQPALVGKVCKMRVRLHDGRVVQKEFGSQCAVAALFAYCRSELGAGGAAARPFRLLRFAGAVREEIGDENASFESLRLHMSTVCVELG